MYSNGHNPDEYNNDAAHFWRDNCGFKRKFYRVKSVKGNDDQAQDGHRSRDVL